MTKTRSKSLRAQIAEQWHRRQAALKQLAANILAGRFDISATGLVPVCCETCTRPIATTSVDQAKGEPPILLEFPENANGWTCTDCHKD